MGSYYIPARVRPSGLASMLFQPAAAEGADAARPRLPARAAVAEALGLDDCLAAWRPFDSREAAGVRNLLISICSDRGSRLHAGILLLAADLRARGHKVHWVHDTEKLEGGDICLFLGYARGVDFELAGLHTHNLLVSESALFGGYARIPVCLLAADASIEGGLRQLKEFFVPRRGQRQNGSPCETVRRLCLSFVKRYPDSLLRDFPR